MATHSAYDIYSDIITNKIYPQTRFKAHYIGYENTGHVGRLLINNGVPELHEGNNNLYIIFVNNMGNPSIFSLNDHNAIFSIDNDEDMSDDEYDSDWFEINEQEVNGGKRKSKKKISKKIKTKKKIKGGGTTPSKMKFFRELEEEAQNEQLADSFFRQRSDAADDGSDVGSVDDKSIPTTTASTPPSSPPIPRYERVGPSDVKVVKPLDIIPRKLTSHEEVALENGLEYWPHSAGPLEGALPIPVPARAIDQPFYSLAPITTPQQRRYEQYSSNPIPVAIESNRRIREEPTGQRGQIGYLQLIPSDLALLQEEMRYAPIRQAEEDEQYARRVQRRQERAFINQDEEYARRVQNELDGNTRRQTRCRGRRCTISGGKRKTKSNTKKNMKGGGGNQSTPMYVQDENGVVHVIKQPSSTIKRWSLPTKNKKIPITKEQKDAIKAAFIDSSNQLHRKLKDGDHLPKKQVKTDYQEWEEEWLKVNRPSDKNLGLHRRNKKGGKKTKKHRKKQMKKSRKKYKGGSGEAPSSSAITPAQAKRDEEQRLFDDYLFQQTIQNQIKKNEKRIHDSSRKELESLQNFREISKKIIDKLENQIILNEGSIDEVKTKFNIVIETPNLDLNYIQKIERKMKSNIEECNSHVETWKKEMKKTLHSLEENRRKGDIMSTHKVSQREMDDHIFHRETLEKMIHYYQILISINTKAIEDFNKLLNEKLAPIKEEIVAKEFEDFDLEGKKSPMKSSKKKGKKKK